MTDPKGRILRSGFESRAPRNAIEFSDYFQRSELAELNRQDMAAYRAEFIDTPKRASLYIESAQAEHARCTRTGSPYIISIPMQARALMLRRLQIIRGAKAAQIIQVACVILSYRSLWSLLIALLCSSFILQAVIVGTVFVRLSTDTSTFFSRGGVLFL